MLSIYRTTLKIIYHLYIYIGLHISGDNVFCFYYLGAMSDCIIYIIRVVDSQITFIAYTMGADFET